MLSIRNGRNNDKAIEAAPAIEETREAYGFIGHLFYGFIGHLLWLLDQCISLIIFLPWLLVQILWGIVKGPVPFILHKPRLSVWVWPFIAWYTYFWALWWWGVLGRVSPSAQQLGRDAAAAVVCPIPALNSSLALCEVRPQLLLPQPFNMTKITSSREELVAVVDRLSEHEGLTTGLSKHQSAVRVLSIRVAASNIPHKHEVLYDLEALIHNTWDTANHLSDFTTMIGRMVDWVRWEDIHVAWDLDKLAKRQRDSMEMGRARRVLAMFSALGRPEDQAKELFVTATDRVTGKLNALVDNAEALLLDFENIQDILGHLKETTIGEIGDQPTQNVLGALWVLLSRPDGGREDPGEGLLRDLMQFYTTESSLARDITLALRRARAELEELGIEQVDPDMLLQDLPLEVMANKVRIPLVRLAASRARFRAIRQSRMRRDVPDFLGHLDGDAVQGSNRR